MKVLFVSSGNSMNGISPVVKRQGESLISAGITVHYYRIKGKGLKGYLSNIILLRKEIKRIKPDIVHAHYSLTAIVSTLAGAKPLVVSLMGSDVKATGILKLIIRFLCILFWKQTIVKSEEMKKSMSLNNVHVIPNGVNTKIFKPEDKFSVRNKLNWTDEKKHLLFAANPERPEKNFKLAEKTLKHIDIKNFEIHVLRDVPPDEIPIWMNAADVTLLTSFREGSPNVIKEAMACNCPIVATDVGDIRWMFGDEPGHFISSFNSMDMAKKIELALAYSEKKGSTNGRSRIVSLGLDSKSIANKIINVYKSVLAKNE